MALRREDPVDPGAEVRSAPLVKIRSFHLNAAPDYGVTIGHEEVSHTTRFTYPKIPGLPWRISAVPGAATPASAACACGRSDDRGCRRLGSTPGRRERPDF